MFGEWGIYNTFIDQTEFFFKLWLWRWGTCLTFIKNLHFFELEFLKVRCMPHPYWQFFLIVFLRVKYMTYPCWQNLNYFELLILKVRHKTYPCWQNLIFLNLWFEVEAHASILLKVYIFLTWVFRVTHTHSYFLGWGTCLKPNCFYDIKLRKM